MHADPAKSGPLTLGASVYIAYLGMPPWLLPTEGKGLETIHSPSEDAPFGATMRYSGDGLT